MKKLVDETGVKEYERIMDQIKVLEASPNLNRPLLEALREKAEELKCRADSNLEETVDPLELAMISLSGVSDQPMGPITSHNSVDDDGRPNSPANPNADPTSEREEAENGYSDD